MVELSNKYTTVEPNVSDEERHTFTTDNKRTEHKYRENKKNIFSKLTQLYIHTFIYIPLTLDPRRGSRDVSDVHPRCPRFTKMTWL
jgi:hypothetical protein